MFIRRSGGWERTPTMKDAALDLSNFSTHARNTQGMEERYQEPTKDHSSYTKEAVPDVKFFIAFPSTSKSLSNRHSQRSI